MKTFFKTHAGRQAPLHLVVSPRPGLDPGQLLLQLAERPGLLPGQLVLHIGRRGEALGDVALHAAERARADGGIVVACGGDGTINTVAQAVWPLGLPMAVLPLGTFNFFSRDHGLDQEPLVAFDRLLQALPEARCRATPVSLVNDQLFVVNCSLGLYARMLAEREKAKQRLGRHGWVALVCGLRALLHDRGSQALTLTARDARGLVHESQIEVATLFIGCNALQLGRLGFNPQAPAPDGTPPMRVLMMPPLDRLARTRLAWRAMAGRLPDEPDVQSFECTELELHAGAAQGSARRRLRVAIDGESRWLHLPLRVTRGMRPLWLVAAPAAEPAAAVAA